MILFFIFYLLVRYRLFFIVEYMSDGDIFVFEKSGVMFYLFYIFRIYLFIIVIILLILGFVNVLLVLSVNVLVWLLLFINDENMIIGIEEYELLLCKCLIRCILFIFGIFMFVMMVLISLLTGIFFFFVVCLSFISFLWVLLLFL